MDYYCVQNHGFCVSDFIVNVWGEGVKPSSHLLKWQDTNENILIQGSPYKTKGFQEQSTRFPIIVHFQNRPINGPTETK